MFGVQIPPKGKGNSDLDDRIPSRIEKFFSDQAHKKESARKKNSTSSSPAESA